MEKFMCYPPAIRKEDDFDFDSKAKILHIALLSATAVVAAIRASVKLIKESSKESSKGE